MRKIRGWINDIKLRHKLLLFYSGFCLLPVFVLFMFSFYQMKDIISEKEETNLKSYLYQSVAAMESSLEVYVNLSDYIAFDQNLTKALESQYDSPYDQYVKVTEVVDSIVETLKHFHTDIKKVTIYTDNAMIKNGTTVAPLSEIKHQSWYQSVLLTHGLYWYVDEEERNVIAARTMPIETVSGNPCILYIEIDYDKLFSPYEQTLTSEYGVFITDKAGQVLYSTSRFSEENNDDVLTYGRFVEEKVKADNSEYTIISQDSSDISDWVIWLYQSKSITGREMKPVRNMTILTVFLCLIGLVLAYFVIKRLSSRIEKLTESMQEVENGNLEVQVTSMDRDEIGLLYRGFGKMLAQIQMLIQEVYVSKIAQKELEMKALQAQINPHFLYNTLSLINWKALTAGEEDISKMTLAMSTFYRTALNKGKNTLSVEDELKNTKAYLEIQSMIHDNDFDYEIVVEPEIMRCESLNLILQPFVENAIAHGIERKTDGERGRIVIRGWKEDDCIWFSVEDNGEGMNQDTANRILTMESKGYGVRNINERIRLFYGEEYKVEVQSEIGKGTIMKFHFPINNKKTTLI